MSAHVCLAIMAKCDPMILQRAVDSARQLIDSACIMIAPRDFDVLPVDGFGYCCLETRVAERKWTGFASTRTALYETAGSDPKVEWILMLDADDTFAPGSKLPDLKQALALGADSIHIPIEHHGLGFRWRWFRGWHLLRARRGFTWKGYGETELHEKLVAPTDSFSLRHERIIYTLRDEAPPRDESLRAEWKERNSTRAGGRDYEDDWKTLFHATDTHGVFLRAMAAKGAAATMPWDDDAQQRWRQMAFETFRKRTEMVGGSKDETFWSWLMMGYLSPTLENPTDGIAYFAEAASLYTDRAEPYHAIAAAHAAGGMHELAKAFRIRAAEQRYPKDTAGFVAVHCYSAEALHEVGIE